jgi:hypothetical protein
MMNLRTYDVEHASELCVCCEILYEGWCEYKEGERIHAGRERVVGEWVS